MTASPPTKAALTPSTDPAHATAGRAPVRHRADLARLVLALVLTGAGLLALLLDRKTALGVDRDILALVDWMPEGLDRAIVGTIQLVALGAPVCVLAALLWYRQFRALGTAVLGAGLGAVAMALVSQVVDPTAPVSVAQEARDASFVTGGAFPSATYLAAATGALVALAPWASRRWRRAGWVLLALVAFCRIATAAELPLILVPALSLGAAAGSLALLLLGGPPRWPSTQGITEALRRGGLPEGTLVPLSVAARNSQPFGFDDGNSRSLFVKVVGRDERDAQLLARFWRSIRVKGIEDEKVVSSPRASLERQALVALLVRDAGGRAPQPLFVGEIGESAALAAFTSIEGERLSDLDGDQIGNELVRDVWGQVAVLHGHRIAHRWLNAGNVLVDRAGQAWIVGYSYADQAAEEEALAADVAELLCSLSLLVGARRAVAGAVAALGRDRVATALPLLQPLALTSETRAELRRHKEVLKELRSEVQSATGTPEFKPTRIERIGLRQVLMVVATVAVVYILLVQFSEAGDIGEALANADWIYLVPVLLFAASTYPSAAVSLLGAVTEPIPLIRTTVVQLGQSFLNRFTPCNAGGMALRVRYLQKRGTDVTEGAAAVGLTSAASGVMQVMLIVGFYLAASTDESGPAVSLPKTSTIAVVILVVLVASAVLLLTRWGRRVLLRPVIDILKRCLHTIALIARSPAKMAMLLGGAGLSKLGYIAAFDAACHAFGVRLDFGTAGAVYMTATTIGAAVPTPGGVGGIEAALVACLTAVGVESSLAVSSMLLFRGATYWLPVIPGYAAFWYLQRVDAV